MEDQAFGPMGALFTTFGVFLWLAVYLFFSYCLMNIAKKTGQTDLWMAWVPIAQAVLLLRIARKPIWWLILFFVPCVGFIVGIIVFMAVAEARGKPAWMGVLMIVPVVNLAVLVYLAFAD